MKKNTRKNKTKQSVVWPTSAYFTIADLQKLNPKFINITLRVRLTNAIQKGEIAEIGALTGGSGRPLKVFTVAPVTQTVLNKARSENINLVDNAVSLVNVVNVSNPKQVVTPTNVASPSIVKVN